MLIKKRILGTLLGMAIIPPIFFLVLTYINSRNMLVHSSIRELEVMAELKAKIITTFFNDVKDNVSIAQDSYDVKTKLPVVSRFSNDRTNPEYIEAKNILDGQLRKWLKTKYYVNDIILLSSEGKIVYSVKREISKFDSDKSLSDYIALAFQEGKKRIFVSHVFKSSNDSYAYKFGLLITAPVYDLEKQFIGAVVFEINMAPVYELIQDYTGLGKTGETMVVRKEGDYVLFLNPLRHNPDSALQKMVRFGDELAIPAQNAASGGTGSCQMRDYRNVEVIAAWSYLPTLDWGIVAKIDLREVLAPVYLLRNQAIIIWLVAIVLLVVTSLVTAESISRPIRILHKGTEIIGRGNLDYKVGSKIDDEIGQLSRSFDRMTEGLKEVTASRDELNREIVTRDKLEKWKELNNRILQCLAGPEKFLDVIHKILKLIQEETELEVVALRLRKGDDYPYFVQYGFPDKFVEAENYLCERDKKGKLVRDNKGIPVLDCMCGNVIRGWTDPKLPFFTFGGSFWTNCTTDLLATTTEKDRQGHSRNRCNSEGYESVALIPLRVGSDIVGLLQMNDKHKNRFDLEFISFMEGIGLSIGSSFMRRQMEEELNKKNELLEETNRIGMVGGWELDLATNKVVWSSETYRIHQVDESYEPNLDEGVSFYAPESMPVLKSAIKKASESGEPFDLELQFIPAKTKETIWVRAIGKAHKQDGKIFKLSGIFQNIDARKKVEDRARCLLAEKTKMEVELSKAEEIKKAYEELQRMQERLIRSEKMAALGKFGGMISHELRNPFGAMTNSVYYLKTRLENVMQDEKIKKHIGILEQELNRSDRIINDTLLFLRIKSPVLSKIDINQIISNALFEGKIPECIKIEKQLSEGLPQIEAEGQQLMRVFNNLITNAIDAMPNGGTLAVDSRKRTEGIKNIIADCVEISFTDTGAGIDDENKSKLFEPLFTTKTYGTGFGLAICKDIVELHGGIIEIESKLNQGTKIKITLPVSGGGGVKNGYKN
jgi:signal transduction histidine kinase